MWMGEEESRSLPDAREQLIQIIGGRRTLRAWILNAWIDIIEQTTAGVLISSYSWRSFTFSTVSRTAPDLIVRMTEEVRDPSVNIDDGRDGTSVHPRGLST